MKSAAPLHEPHRGGATLCGAVRVGSHHHANSLNRERLGRNLAPPCTYFPLGSWPRFRSGFWRSSLPKTGVISDGQARPLGIEWVEVADAFNFGLYSRQATGVTLLCRAENDPTEPIFEFRFQHPAHTTDCIWHCRILAVRLSGATLYVCRVEGPQDPEHGQRFDSQKILPDLHAPSVFFLPKFSHEACSKPGPAGGCAPLGRRLKRG